jgi:hypothetical protein
MARVKQGMSVFHIVTRQHNSYQQRSRWRNVMWNNAVNMWILCVLVSLLFTNFGGRGFAPVFWHLIVVLWHIFISLIFSISISGWNWTWDIFSTNLVKLAQWFSVFPYSWLLCQFIFLIKSVIREFCLQDRAKLWNCLSNAVGTVTAESVLLIFIPISPPVHLQCVFDYTEVTGN